MTWHTGTPPRQGEYVAIDRVYGHRSVSTWTPERGWCINGRWLGHDGAQCWTDAPELPQDMGEQHAPSR